VNRVALLAALFLGALALRPQLVGVGPLLPEIDDDLDVSHAVAGLLVPYLADRAGSRRQWLTEPIPS
jgi:cyanate permease